MKAKALKPGHLYATAAGPVRFEKFDGLGFAVCVPVRDGRDAGAELQLTLRELIEAITVNPHAPPEPGAAGGVSR